MLSCFATSASKSTLTIHAVTKEGLASFLKKQSKAQAQWLDETGFKATAGAIAPLPGKNGAITSYVFGLGKKSKEHSPLLYAKLGAEMPSGRYKVSGKLTEMDALAWGLGTYEFNRYKTAKSKKPRSLPKLELPKAINGKRLSSMVEGHFLSRNLINTPAEDMGPSQLEAQVRRLARQFKAKLAVTKGDALLKKNFPLIHAVGRASDDAPRLLDITWGKPSHPKVTLVGKGVCFDTGGLDLKPSGAMLLMKKDMGGAAAVLGLAHMIMANKLPIRLRVLVPCVENNVSANAYRASDVFKSRKGITVEIGNTDAEGRLVVADALAEADREKPDLLVDMCTLTGAARVAMGPELPPYFTDDEQLAKALEKKQ